MLVAVCGRTDLHSYELRRRDGFVSGWVALVCAFTHCCIALVGSFSGYTRVARIIIIVYIVALSRCISSLPLRQALVVLLHVITTRTYRCCWTVQLDGRDASPMGSEMSEARRLDGTIDEALWCSGASHHYHSTLLACSAAACDAFFSLL